MTNNFVWLKIKSFFSEGHIRSIRIKKNIVGLFFLKVISVAVTFMFVPLMLHYLEPVKYGIWLTLSSVVAWVGYFDIGLKNGLRNQLGAALAKGDKKLAKTLVSSTLAMLMGIAVSVYIFFLLANPFLNWTNILRAPISMAHEINLLVIIVFGFFIFQVLVTGLITTVLSTDQRPALADFVNVSGRVLSLVLIYILTLTTRNSLLIAGVSLSMIAALMPLIFGFWFFRRDYREIAPSFRWIDFSRIRGLAAQGAQFFIIQVAALVIFTTDNVIITQLFGPAEVVPYNIAFKLFSHVIIVFGLVIAPFWAAYNEAYTKKDFSWMKRVMKKMIGLWCLLVIGIIFLFAISGNVYHFWIGDKVVMPISLSFFMGIFVIVQTFNMIFITFIFGTGKLFVQTCSAVFGGILNIPLCYLFAKTCGLGISGIILATAVCGVPNLILGPVQCYKLIYGKARGIWAK